MKYRKWLIPFVCILAAMVAVALIVSSGLITKTAEWNGLSHGDTKWTEGWSLEDGERLAFPCRLSVDSLGFEQRLPMALEDGMSLYIKTNYQCITATLDDQPLLVSGVNGGKQLRFNADLPWVSIPLRQSYAGRTIHITLSNTGSKVVPEAYDVRLGLEADIRLDLFEDALPRYLLCLLMVLLAVTLFVFSLLESRRYGNRIALRFLYIVVFVCMACVWFYCDSNISGVTYIGNEMFLFCNIFSYLLLSVPFLLYMRSAYAEARRLFNIEALVIIGHTLLQFVLILLGGFRLWVALTISHVILGAVISTLLVCGYREWRRTSGKGHNELLAGLMVLGVMSFVTMTQFYLTTTEDNSMAFRYGVLAFIVTMAINAMRSDVEFVSRARSYEQLRIREEEYRIAVQQSDKYVMRFEIATRTLRQQNECASLFGMPTEVVGVPESLIESGVVAEESREDLIAFCEDVFAGVPKGSAVFNLCNASGRFVWFHADYTSIFSEDGKPLQSIVSIYDITDLREKELAYEKWKQTYSEMRTESISYYEYNLTHDRFDREEGGLLPPVPENVPRNLTSVAGYITQHSGYPADQDKFRAFFDRTRLLNCYDQGVRSEKMDVRRVGPDGDPLWTTASVQLISDPYSNDVKAFLLLQDINEQKQAEMKQRARSDADPLTGLLNRTAFVEHVTELITSIGPQRTHALIMIDVDGFKRVNDTFGHQFGDRVLIDVANDLRAMMRADDLIGRIGGDEYIVCLKNVPAESDFLERRSETICQTLNKQFGTDVAISGSLGLALYPRDGSAFDELYQKADKALYFAKHHGKNRFIFYNSDLLKGDMTAPSAATMLEAPAEPSVVWQKQHGERTLLIVDDVELNREILGEIFHEEYHILMAESGEETLRLLQSAETPITAVLLDLIMPGMSGLDVLQKMQEDSFMNTIPVIVTSAADETEYSLKAIELGATDFVSKPIDPRLVKLRVHSAIQKRESDELRAQNRYLLVQKSDESRHQNELRYMAEHDSLTNICNKGSFYRKTKAMIDAAPDTTFVMIAFDIEKFRVINDIFGHEEGDRLLRYIAQRLQDMYRAKATYSRIDADDFAICLPYNIEELRSAMAQADHEMFAYDLPFDVMLSYGAYIIDDRSLAVNIMHDRAEMAKRTVKGNYVRRFAYYDDALREELLHELDIVNQMQSALDAGQFDIYLQPKCNLSNGVIVGAEALVRWLHPQRGVLSPGTFIPVFEKNGFIMKLDAYIWERVCQLLRRWMDENDGKCPVRISTNISRVDIYNPNLCKTLIDLVHKYRIPPELMELEITESAYAENAKMLLEVVAELRRNGFVVEMDDFGSGYSSLNMLKDINVDVLKIDMRFLFGADEDGRGGSILSSVVRMARWLSLPVIAEGVETAEQARFLYSIGCGSGQGYYFYHPMPVDAFEKLLTEKPHEQLPITDGGKADAIVRKVWSMDSDFNFMLESIVCAASLCEMTDTSIEQMRVNDAYLRLMNETAEAFFKRRTCVADHMCEDDYRHVFAMLTRARNNRSIVEDRFTLRDSGQPVQYMARFLSGDAKRSLFFVTYAPIDDKGGEAQ